MLRISRSVEYGLIAVDYLASLQGGLARSRDLSEGLNLPAGIVAKILQRLTSAGIVVSEQGAHGGYRLGRSLDDLSFLELSEAIDGTQHVTPCSVESECERRPYCTVSGAVTNLGTQIIELMSGISVGRLLRAESLGHRKGAAV